MHPLLRLLKIMVDAVASSETMMKRFYVAIESMGVNMKDKFKIAFHEDLTGETFEWHLYPEDFKTLYLENLEELKEHLEHEGVLTIDLKYMDLKDNSNQLQEWNINVEHLDKEHFEWLITETYGIYKFLEISSKMKNFK